MAVANADTAMSTTVREMMGGPQMQMGSKQHMGPTMRRQMMARMRERMQAMTPER